MNRVIHDAAAIAVEAQELEGLDLRDAEDAGVSDHGRRLPSAGDGYRRLGASVGKWGVPAEQGGGIGVQPGRSLGGQRNG